MLRTATVLQYVAPRGNAGSFPLCPVGSIRFSGRNGRARTSFQFGPKSIRRHRRARTGFRRFDVPSPNVRAALPSRCWADFPRAPWLGGAPSRHGSMPSEQPVASGPGMSPFVPKSHPHPFPSAPRGPSNACREPGLVFPNGSKPETTCSPRGTPFGSWGPKFERRTSLRGSRPPHARRQKMGPIFPPRPHPWPVGGLQMLPGRRAGSVNISSGRPPRTSPHAQANPKWGFPRHARYPIP